MGTLTHTDTHTHTHACAEVRLTSFVDECLACVCYCVGFILFATVDKTVSDEMLAVFFHIHVDFPFVFDENSKKLGTSRYLTFSMYLQAMVCALLFYVHAYRFIPTLLCSLLKPCMHTCIHTHTHTPSISHSVL